jgi:hypothetical protein
MSEQLFLGIGEVVQVLVLLLRWTILVLHLLDAHQFLLVRVGEVRYCLAEL